jgi:hypothetical protein
MPSLDGARCDGSARCSPPGPCSRSPRRRARAPSGGAGDPIVASPSMASARTEPRCAAATRASPSCGYMQAGRKRRTPRASVQYGCSQRAAAPAVRACAGRRFVLEPAGTRAGLGAATPALLTNSRSGRAAALRASARASAEGADARDSSGQRSGKRRTPEASMAQAGMQLDGITPAVARVGARLRTADRAVTLLATERARAAGTEAAKTGFAAADRPGPSAPHAPPAMSPDPSKANERTPMRTSQAMRQECSSPEPAATQPQAPATHRAGPNPNLRRETTPTQLEAPPRELPQWREDARRAKVRGLGPPRTRNKKRAEPWRRGPAGPRAEFGQFGNAHGSDSPEERINARRAKVRGLGPPRTRNKKRAEPWRRGPAGPRAEFGQFGSCEGEDSNLHGSYPASTSSWCVCHSATLARGRGPKCQ